MSTSILRVIKDHYATYVNAQSGLAEGHKTRLFAQTSIALILSLTLTNFSEGAISAIITSLSILAGFSFSAMFPVAADIKSGLPDPVYSEDRDDISRLGTLSSYFRANVSFFIPLTIFCIIIFSIQLLDPIHNEFTRFIISQTPLSTESIKNITYYSKIICSKALIFISIFTFIETLYTFYRMCFTVLFILRIKDEYRETHNQRNRYK